MVKLVMPSQYIILQKRLKFLEKPKILLRISSSSTRQLCMQLFNEKSGGGEGVVPLRSRGLAGEPREWPSACGQASHQRHSLGQLLDNFSVSSPVNWGWESE